jgi:hypothetical protein
VISTPDVAYGFGAAGSDAYLCVGRAPRGPRWRSRQSPTIRIITLPTSWKLASRNTIGMSPHRRTASESNQLWRRQAEATRVSGRRRPRETEMSADEFAKIAAALAWPTTALLALSLFHTQMRALLQRLSETLTFKSLKVKALGAETELTAEYARTVLHELLDDITESTNSLSDPEVKLFDAILETEQSQTVDELIPGFRREDQNHQRLRNLRDQKLIIPMEGGQWKPEKHPVVTRYGRLIAKLRRSSASNVQNFKSYGND